MLACLDDLHGNRPALAAGGVPPPANLPERAQGADWMVVHASEADPRRVADDRAAP